MKKIYLTALFAVALAGCSKMYTLPDPPPQSEWVEAEQPKEDPEVVARRVLDAKRAAIQCYAALASKKWERALELMSIETRQAFESAADGQGAAAVFEQGAVMLHGEKQAFDPIADVFIANLTDIRDEFGGRTDKEGPSRHVYYAVDANGNAREIVLIHEEDQWRIHRPEIFSLLLAP